MEGGFVTHITGYFETPSGCGSAWSETGTFVFGQTPETEGKVMHHSSFSDNSQRAMDCIKQYDQSNAFTGTKERDEM